MPSRTLVAEEKSMSGFKMRSWLSQGPMQLVALSGGWCFCTTPNTLGPWRTLLNLLCLCLCKATTKPGWLIICLQHGLLLRWSAQKRFLSKHYCSLTMFLVTQELWWRRATRLTSFSCLLTQHPSVAMDQGVVSIFKSYSLRNTFYEAITAIDSDSSGEYGQRQLKTFWKGFTVLDTIKNICDSWEEVKLPSFTGVWKKMIATLMDDSGGVQDFSGGSNCRCGGCSKRTRNGALRCDSTAAISG